jgi:cysteinyl-tRNA synthetase
MDDDLNTSVALAAVWELVRRVNARLDDLGERPISEAEADAGLDAFTRIDAVLGSSRWPLARARRRRPRHPRGGAARERQSARAARDFARADAIRQELTGDGDRRGRHAHRPTLVPLLLTRD